jgi:hypothetical protein
VNTDKSEETMSFHPRLPRLLEALLGLALLGAPAAFGQERGPRTLTDLKSLPGPVVAESVPAAGTPDGEQAVVGYSVRRLALPRPWRVTLAGQTENVTQAWHVTLHFARRLTVRSQAFSLLIDGRWCGFLAEAADLRSADAVCFDPTLVRSGATLAATYRAVTILPAGDETAPEVEFDGDGDEPLLRAAAPLQIQEVR